MLYKLNTRGKEKLWTDGIETLKNTTILHSTLEGYTSHR
jgi:hypothetical protein